MVAGITKFGITCSIVNDDRRHSRAHLEGCSVHTLVRW